MAIPVKLRNPPLLLGNVPFALGCVPLNLCEVLQKGFPMGMAIWHAALPDPCRRERYVGLSATERLLTWPVMRVNPLRSLWFIARRLRWAYCMLLKSTCFSAEQPEVLHESTFLRVHEYDQP